VAEAPPPPPPAAFDETPLPPPPTDDDIAALDRELGDELGEGIDDTEILPSLDDDDADAGDAADAVVADDAVVVAEIVDEVVVAEIVDEEPRTDDEGATGETSEVEELVEEDAEVVLVEEVVLAEEVEVDEAPAVEEVTAEDVVTEVGAEDAELAEAVGLEEPGPDLPPPPIVDAPPPPPDYGAAPPPPAYEGAPPPPAYDAAPPPPGYEAAPPPVPPPPAAPIPPALVDPFGLGAAVDRLGASAKRSSRVALGIVSAILDDDERVEALVCGRYLDRSAVAVVTPERLLVINDREWRPDVVTIVVEPGLVVQGWQDDRTATLVFESAGVQTTVDRIVDRPLAHEMANLLRYRAANAEG
jgi:hypothetical protein